MYDNPFLDCFMIMSGVLLSLSMFIALWAFVFAIDTNYGSGMSIHDLKLRDLEDEYRIAAKYGITTIIKNKK